jgi:ATP-dependent exoDNAse (exonuclease V) beta subunit
MRDLYVALTRATQRLDVVYDGPLPAVLSRLLSDVDADAETESDPVSLVGAQH